MNKDSTPILTCPSCNSSKVVSASEQYFMVNTSEYYCEAVKPHDSEAKSFCRKCKWHGQYSELKVSVQNATT